MFKPTCAGLLRLIPDYFSLFAGDSNLHQLVVVLIVEPEGPLSALELQGEARKLAIRPADLHLFEAYGFQADAHGRAVFGNHDSERNRSSRALHFCAFRLAVLSQVAPGEKFPMYEKVVIENHRG